MLANLHLDARQLKHPPLEVVSHEKRVRLPLLLLNLTFSTARKLNNCLSNPLPVAAASDLSAPALAGGSDSGAVWGGCSAGRVTLRPSTQLAQVISSDLRRRCQATLVHPLPSKLKITHSSSLGPPSKLLVLTSKRRSRRQGLGMIYPGTRSVWSMTSDRQSSAKPQTTHTDTVSY